MFTYWLRKRDE
ncbi:hypothetical protein BUZ01_12380 [Staphylococcus gallinarum]|uniref:Uncharacterized protein n=1 Tax=Staphylococcus gallinarum TaxID=1293 RepID=A0A418HKU9_STAGA|nr:hypothetical protein [Staphylococcus gallinarum]PTE78108.1 hypothetical protein BUY96_04715 [Staphylococcus gallinarum]RIL41424.1 hypothetical protein BUZ01_12380 [Staphylococcus gallinarum]RIO91981.1 hypothetical protein BUZ04_08215 [Staphylococcus gallinarum]